ncbi:MAG: hypothetical protein ACXAD7_04200 [Candidatus Kariarchaeaceae archaeon]|jgi:GTPase SAR1 family protein
MSKQILAAGSIIPLGDGLTGKSVITQLLMRNEITEQDKIQVLSETKKSLNIEMEFVASKRILGDEEIDVSQQYYVFPGQRQRIRDIAPSFDEILEIFDFLPALKNVSVILLLYDTTRIESLKSLESWLSIAVSRGWVDQKTSIILVANKIDLQVADEQFIQNVADGIYNLMLANKIEYDRSSIKAIQTSCVTLDGIHELKEMILDWISLNGKRMARVKA